MSVTEVIKVKNRKRRTRLHTFNTFCTYRCKQSLSIFHMVKVSNIPQARVREESWIKQLSWWKRKLGTRLHPNRLGCILLNTVAHPSKLIIPYYVYILTIPLTHTQKGMENKVLCQEQKKTDLFTFLAYIYCPYLTLSLAARLTCATQAKVIERVLTKSIDCKTELGKVYSQRDSGTFSEQKWRGIKQKLSKLKQEHT